jgi:hypothetical protein
LTTADTGTLKPPRKLEDLTDIIGRNFRQLEEGLGFDDSPCAHVPNHHLAAQVSVTAANSTLVTIALFALVWSSPRHVGSRALPQRAILTICCSRWVTLGGVAKTALMMLSASSG